MARTNRPDEAYHIPTLNVWFALSGIALFATSVWMVMADYNRSWKTTQRDFRDLERDRLAIEKSVAEKEVNEAEVKKAQDAVEQAQAALKAKQDEVKKQLTVIEKLEQEGYYVAKMNYNFARATLGERRYQLEEYAAHNPKDVAGINKRRQAYDCEVYRVEGGPKPQGCPDNPEGKSLKTSFLDHEDELLAAQAARDALLEEQKKAQAAVDAALAQVIKIEKALEPIAANFFNENFRDAPLLDFLVPTLKIKQAVITDIRDNYNFATVQKEDRCMTCHLGIDRPDYEVHAETNRFLKPSTRLAMEASLMEALRTFIDQKAPASERAELKEALTELANKPEMTPKAWLDENLEDEALTKAFLDSNKELLTDLYIRTQTYKAHPNLSLYMTSGSPHPIEAYGCSVCHEGRGHATEFVRAYHTPNTKEDQQRWEETYGWEAPHYWDYPQLPSKRVTSSCAKCHDAEPTVVGADALNEGKDLVASYGCYGCHRIEGMTGVLRKAGPALQKLPAKVGKEFAFSWIWNPKHFRPSTKMPRFFEQSNNSQPKWLALTQQEVRGIVAYLYANSEPFTVSEIPKNGDAATGKRVFEEVGCLGCHSMEGAGQTVNDHGPDLSGIGSKLSAEWIYTWVKNPREYFPETHMPSMRLSDQEAADVTAYLVSLKKKGYTPIPTPGRDEELQKALLTSALETSMRRSELEALFNKMSADEREVLLGEKAIAKYGCAGCHDIKGFEDAGPIGTELSTWGDKFITQLDFGLIPYHGSHAEVDYTHIDWAKHKLTQPRFWDRGKEETKFFAELLKMPNFEFNEQQVDRLVTFLMSRRKQDVHVDKQPSSKSPHYAAVQSGRWLVKEYNCQGCHYFDNDGGYFAQYWSIDATGQAQFASAKGKPEFNFLQHIPGPVRGHTPPLLLDQGNKTKPGWLFGFLHDPSTKLRPQLKMRMPTFQFNDSEANRLVAMFAGLESQPLGVESSFEPDPQLAVIGQELFTRGQCTRCHLFSEQTPNVVPPGVVAPNLKLAAERLQRTWTPRWLENPQSIMPGANMPNYFDLESKFTSLDVEGELLDEDGNGSLSEEELRRGMEAISHYLITSGRGKSGPSTARR